MICIFSLKTFFESQKKTILDSDLDFGTEYFYKITAVDALDKESHPSIAVKGTTRDFVEPPILSSMKNDSRIILIWNEVKIAKSYNINFDIWFYASM